jgi:S-adenosylmethionine hydrolase
LEKYKKLCHYKDLNDFFENNQNILNDIDINKLKESNMIDIIKQIPEYIIDKIENINEENLLKELTKENNNHWKYKCLKIENNKSIRYIDDFGMIDNNLKNNFFKEKKFKVLKEKYVIGKKGIFIFIPYGKNYEISFYEIGNFDENDNFII